MWIEILIQTDEDHLSMSLPSRECGLKSKEYDTLQYSNSVTPFAGVWIEIGRFCYGVSSDFVTPFAGVWIEI